MSPPRSASPRAAAGLLLFAGTWLAVACSSSNSQTSPKVDAAVPLCPTTPEAAIGASCSTEGLSCGPLFTCGEATFALLCVCRSGTFQCQDGSGQDVTAPPACPAGTDAASSCPPTEARALGASCTEIGLPCAYPSSCAGRFDNCECTAGVLRDGGYGVRFECLPVNCETSDAAAVSFGDASAEASSAPINDGSPSDAVPPDAVPPEASTAADALGGSALDSPTLVPEAGPPADSATE